MLDFIEQAITFLVELVNDWGYAGIFVMMFLESTFFPFPSEVAMIPAGFLAYKGEMSASGAVFAGTAGSLLGAYFNYYLGRKVGVPLLRRYGRFFFFSESKLERCNRIFRRHGEIATFVCRLVPVVRQYISLPAGISGMSLWRFGAYTTLGAGIWVAILTGFGYWLGGALETPTWETFRDSFRGHWAEHKWTILICVSVPLAAIVAAYVAYHRRRSGVSAETGKALAQEGDQ